MPHNGWDTQTGLTEKSSFPYQWTYGGRIMATSRWKGSIFWWDDIKNTGETFLNSKWFSSIVLPVYSDGHFSLVTLQLQATGAKQSQIQRLLMDLPKRGPNAYPDFIECLIETEQQHIVDKLNEIEQSLRSKEPKYITPMHVSVIQSLWCVSIIISHLDFR